MTITEYKEYQAALLEEAKLEENTNIYKEEVDIQAKKDAKKMLVENYSKFRVDVKDLLLSEALNMFVNSAIKNSSGEIRAYTESMICNYVKSNGGCDKILYEARLYHNTYLLERLSTLIEDYATLIYEGTDKDDPETFKVNPDDKNNFLDDLDKEDDIESVKQAIILRVTNAEEEFINNNNADKININSIIKDTTSRINSSLSDDSNPDEVNEAVVADLTRSSKRKINTIREQRTNNVFEEYVLFVAESVITNPEVLKEYQTEDSKLDMGKIVNFAKGNYAILETINTIKLEDINTEYIKNLFK